ncbi:MAG: sulfotransferase [Bacteroidota bacterium]
MNKLKLGRLLLTILSVFPKKYSIESKKDIPEPFFILNSGRCGSTLFNRLLNQHSQIFLPEEQYFLHLLIIKFRLYNWILWRDLGKILAGELMTSLGTHWWDFDCRETYKDIVCATGDERSLKSVIDKIFKAYAQQTGKSPQIWGDSTPPLIGRYAKEVYRAYPDAKYLLLVRDPRDVIASFKKGADTLPFMHLENVVKAAENWKNVYDMAKWVNRRTSAFKIVRYEELVSDPKRIVEETISFLGLENQDLNFTRATFPDNRFYNMPYHKNLKNPINQDSIGKWKTELSDKELNDVMPIIEKPMLDLGYVR